MNPLPCHLDGTAFTQPMNPSAPCHLDGKAFTHLMDPSAHTPVEHILCRDQVDGLRDQLADAQLEVGRLQTQRDALTEQLNKANEYSKAFQQIATGAPTPKTKKKRARTHGTEKCYISCFRGCRGGGQGML